MGSTFVLISSENTLAISPNTHEVNRVVQNLGRTTDKVDTEMDHWRKGVY